MAAGLAILPRCATLQAKDRTPEEITSMIM